MALKLKFYMKFVIDPYKQKHSYNTTIRPNLLIIFLQNAILFPFLKKCKEFQRVGRL